MSTPAELIQARVKAITYETRAICSYELQAEAGQQLPPFTAGAHIDLHLPNGMVRSYSLCNDPAERGRYVLGVNRDPASRGGSACLHQAVRPGDVLGISAPRNHFPLDEGAPHSVFIAGGIGITPLWSMIQRLQQLGRSWQLFYSVRQREDAAFLERLAGYGERVRLNCSAAAGGRRLDFGALLQQVPTGSHLYCCGPAAMIESFQQAASGWPAEQVHVEYFGAREAPAADGGYTVVLSRSGRSIPVCAGKTILESLIAAGVEVPYSCGQGVCGACETAVLDGVPDHRDMVLSPAEQAANKTMMVCCSGSKGERLVLDL